jgi:hypothetical protein
MEKIQLKFTSPGKLETLSSSTEINKVVWTYGDSSEYPLSLDITKWHVCSDVNGKTSMLGEIVNKN